MHKKKLTLLTLLTLILFSCNHPINFKELNGVWKEKTTNAEGIISHSVYIFQNGNYQAEVTLIEQQDTFTNQVNGQYVLDTINKNIALEFTSLFENGKETPMPDDAKGELQIESLTADELVLINVANGGKVKFSKVY